MFLSETAYTFPEHAIAAHLLIEIVPNKTIDIVFRRETRHFAVAMLPNPLRQIADCAGVKRAVPFVGKDVDRRMTLHKTNPLDSGFRRNDH